jgi:predicted enzyme related to lactoylglutathione lyase
LPNYFFCLFRAGSECRGTNAFVHVELNSTDVDKSKQFYGSLFDWKLQEFPMGPGGYTLIDVGGGTGGGMMKQMIPGATSAWLPYVDVDDLEASTQKAKSLGAKIMKDVTEVPDMGWFSIITDPTGAMLGLWKTKNK